jgi:rhodanese-related sulfurtransferase
MEEKSPKKVLIAIAIGIIVVVAIVGWIKITSGPKKPVLTSSYTIVSAEEAYEIISNTPNITIVDIRNCSCEYNGGHIPEANWSTHPKEFYNSTIDLLIYDQNGTWSIQFCEKLVNHVYGKIYCLEGGIEAWISAGYEIT